MEEVTKTYKASSIVRYYENAMKYAAPLGWSFEQPITGHTFCRCLQHLSVYDGKLDTFKTKGNAGAFISLDKPKYNKDTVVEHHPEMFEVTGPDSEVVITSIRSKYKAIQMTALEEIIDFNWHFLKSI